MTTKHIVDSINQHLISDINYRLVQSNKSDYLVLAENIIFDMTNKNPDTHFAPYFQIESIEQAKEIFMSVFPSITEIELETLFTNVLKANHKVDFTEQVFFAIFRPDRL